MGDRIPFKDEQTPLMRLAEVKDDGSGNEIVQWSLTSKNLTGAVHIPVSPSYVLPIIFVPGIMGSNLALIEKIKGYKAGTPIWLFNGTKKMGLEWAKRNPIDRQRLLDPANTQVYSGGHVPEKVGSIGGEDDIRNNRFWGEVGAASYEEFLVWLSDALNTARGVTDTQRPLVDKDYTKEWGLTSGEFIKALKSEMDHAARISFPVYACGYNWLRSNLDAAETLKNRINLVIKRNNGPYRKCEKVILVTHSMGGLVARACSELKGMQDKIAGIVHGVMPANGAGVAYKRCRAGSEDAAQLVLGVNAAEVSAVFANSPGALQLLPNHIYGQGWLQLGMGAGKAFKSLHALPGVGNDGKQENPYDAIYLTRGKWWSMMREDLINPADIRGHTGWKAYADNVKLAQDFHLQLAPEGQKPKYHPITFSLYGSDDSHKTWEKVRWECASNKDISPSAEMYSTQIRGVLTKDTLNQLRIVRDDGNGLLTLVNGRNRWDSELSDKDAPGDGTVPSCSGSAPNPNSRKSYALKKIDHEGAYRDAHFQRATLHSILKIAMTVKVPA
ncbi:hypothetical protein [Janthinobacterium sp. 17J80-10]|uniref:esterase/lipase family protein n=1 Tax=Janthinobacterium sp. 17J80-10 TaxID=2497863 RepID=UPI0010058512|nr:hypothetical protein [Janthinobacterium sp. 17J80-10]QAU34919.1 hypothetical protein EKL02_12395 [Janthinobacterium sp. 17J80-10]